MTAATTTTGLRRILLVGLGNYGMDSTRHNVGSYWLQHIAHQSGLFWKEHRGVGCDLAEAIWTPMMPAQLIRHSTPSTTSLATTTTHPEQWHITLAIPHGYMNVIGNRVARTMKVLKLAPSNLLIVHDDLERPLGKVSLKNGGSANGHNGVKSIIEEIHTEKFRRLRLGIDRPKSRDFNSVAKYVLNPLRSHEKNTLEASFPLAFANLLTVISEQEQLIATSKPSTP
ncbi:peptidyl-tRNA hydrolase [Syncephalis fuscata]|nr:peptidyl-tRNA hydrolase [Syncephalis fuscata]